jgi:hypothetical protein
MKWNVTFSRTNKKRKELLRKPLVILIWSNLIEENGKHIPVR